MSKHTVCGIPRISTLAQELELKMKLWALGVLIDYKFDQTLSIEKMKAKIAEEEVINKQDNDERKMGFRGHR